MRDTMERDGYKIDDVSQRVLLALFEEDMETGELVDRVEVEHNNTVSYRLREYLIPANLVVLDHSEPNNGISDTNVWTLTGAGEEWVEAHREELAAPSTVREAAAVAESAVETAEEAVSTAEEALSRAHSVQGHDGHLNKLSDRLMGCLDDLGDVEEFLSEVKQLREKTAVERYEAKQEAQRAAEAADVAQQQSGLISSDIEALRADLDSIEKEMDALRSGVESRTDRLSDRVDAIEEQQQDLDDRLEGMAAKQEQIDHRIGEIETEIGQPWWRFW